LSDFQRAAYYGRPLFAYLQKSGKLIEQGDTATGVPGTISSNTLHNVLTRMLASRTIWADDKTSLISILGTRVQMGITTSFVVSSDLVSQAYAHLVDFQMYEDGTVSSSVARITFMPDPVCAALAMGLMQEGWAMDNGSGKVTGKSPRFWSTKAIEIMKSGFCLPERGNFGEIMAALYMLFSGDVLRYRKDPTMRSCSVSRLEW
jgi:hypothetical protein